MWQGRARPAGMPFWSTRPTTVLAGSDHYIRTCCPSVCKSPLFKIDQNKTDLHCRPVLCGLAEWIIDDSCLFCNLILLAKECGKCWDEESGKRRYFYSPYFAQTAKATVVCISTRNRRIFITPVTFLSLEIAHCSSCCWPTRPRPYSIGGR